MLFKVQNQHYVTLVTFVIGLRSSRVNNFTCLAFIDTTRSIDTIFSLKHFAPNERMHTVLSMCVCLSVLLSVRNKNFLGIFLLNHKLQMLEILSHYLFRHVVSCDVFLYQSDDKFLLKDDFVYL